jgi:hypothetical protein
MPPAHWKPEQHALDASQVAPSRPQAAAHFPAEHSKPEQHGAPPAHDAPATPQPVRHTEACPASPATQASWSQQSALLAQVSPSVLQRGAAHRPASHPPEQQSAAVSHAAPSARQARTQCSLRHASPAQQAASVRQWIPSGAHSHSPRRQANEQQSACCVHGARVRPHVEPGCHCVQPKIPNVPATTTIATQATRATSAFYPNREKTAATCRMGAARASV